MWILAIFIVLMEYLVKKLKKGRNCLSLRVCSPRWWRKSWWQAQPAAAALRAYGNWGTRQRKF